jgi:hypothetical protein
LPQKLPQRPTILPTTDAARNAAASNDGCRSHAAAVNDRANDGPLNIHRRVSANAQSVPHRRVQAVRYFSLPPSSRLWRLIPLRDYASNVTDSPKPRYQPGREVAGFQLAPFLPPQHGSQRPHHQGNLRQGKRPPLGCQFGLSAVAEGEKLDGTITRSQPPRGAAFFGLAAGRLSVLCAPGWSIVRVHRVSTRSLWRGAAPGARPPFQRYPFIVLTRATVAFAFYPWHPMADCRPSVLYRGGQAPLKPEQMQPGPQPGRMSHRKGRPGADRNGIAVGSSPLSPRRRIGLLL